MNDFFGPLYGVDVEVVGDEKLWCYWSTPYAKEIKDFNWDTDVPEVTKAWPCMEFASVRDAMASILGSPDVTGQLYLRGDLEKYEASQDAAILVECEYCGTHGCQDKFCGLRGEEVTQIVVPE